MSLKDNVIELNNHKCTVAGVISRLRRYENNILNITCVIEWDDGTHSTSMNHKTTKSLSYEVAILQEQLNHFINTGREE